MPQNNPCVTNGFLPPDIYTQNLATQLTYNIDFDFVAEEDVVVFREQPAGTFTLLTNSAATGATPPNYTINQGVSPAQVTFNTNEAPGGVSLIIGRRTDICDPVVTYQVGAAIRAGDLNASNIQLLHLIQELRSTLGYMINGDNTTPIIPGQGMDLNDLDDVNVGDPVNPDPALLRYNGTEWVGNEVIQSGWTTWPANNTTFATTAAGDERWLQTGPGSNFIGGAGINLDTSTAGQVTVEIDLDTPSGLETDPAGNTGELRINTNDGCEIVAAGLNAETTAASIVQTGGTDDDPAIRIATTLGTATTNTDLAIVGGANTTVTRNSNNELTIESSGGVGTTYRGTVDVTDDATLPANALVNDLFANDTQGTQTANWQTVITGASTTANAGDLLLCTTAAGGVATDARYTLIESGTEIPAANALWEVNSGNLRPVTNTQGVQIRNGNNNTTVLNANGSATFNSTQAGNASNGITAIINNTLASTAAPFSARNNTGPGFNYIGVDGSNNNQFTFSVTADGTFDIGTNLNPAVGVAGRGIRLQADGSAIFNEQGNPVDFRVESDTNSNMLFVDGDQNRVGIGTSAPGEPLDVNGNSQFRGTVNLTAGNNLQLTNAGGTQSVQLNADDATVSYTMTLPPTRPTAANRFLAAAGTGTGADQELEWAAVTVPVEAWTPITTAWNLDNDLLVSITAAGQTVPVPTNQRNGQTGMLRLDVAAAWPAAGGAVFQYAGGTAPNITQFPAVIPFTVITTGTNANLDNGVILWGSPTVNII